MKSQLEPLEAGGLATPQFGQLVRVIIVKVDSMTNLAIVNPEVIKERGYHLVTEKSVVRCDQGTNE